MTLPPVVTSTFDILFWTIYGNAEYSVRLDHR
jgi:hypothetical protein